MPISFSNIPANLKIPLYWVEVDPSKAGLPVLYQPSLIVGVMIAATKSIESAAVASGGTGYAVADTISLDNGIHLAVATIGAAGAITAVTVTGEGSIPANEAPPANPVAQYSTSGARHRRDLHADMGRKSARAQPSRGQSASECSARDRQPSASRRGVRYRVGSRPRFPHVLREQFRERGMGSGRARASGCERQRPA